MSVWSNLDNESEIPTICLSNVLLHKFVEVALHFSRELQARVLWKQGHCCQLVSQIFIQGLCHLIVFQFYSTNNYNPGQISCLSDLTNVTSTVSNIWNDPGLSVSARPGLGELDHLPREVYLHPVCSLHHTAEPCRPTVWSAPSLTGLPSRGNACAPCTTT